MGQWRYFGGLVRGCVHCNLMTSCVSRWFCLGIHLPWYLLNKQMPKIAIFARNYLFQTIVLGIHLSKFKRGRIDFRRATNRSWVYCPCLLEFQNIRPITERLSNAFQDAFGILKDEDKRTEWMKHIQYIPITIIRWQFIWQMILR